MLPAPKEPKVEPLLAEAIEEHLELRRRNARLERTMPLDRYRVAEAEKHGLFTSEAEARREETLGGADGDGGWRVAEGDRARYPPDQFWLPTPAFDWGD
jgi:hypothetical protein